MDKAQNVRAMTTVMMLMLLFAGHSSASFKGCFAGCAVNCLFRGHKILCLLECFPKCLLGVDSQGLDYCKLGCAVDQCAHFANEFNIEDVDKVDNCVNECEIRECGFLIQAMASPISTSYVLDFVLLVAILEDQTNSNVHLIALSSASLNFDKVDDCVNKCETGKCTTTPAPF
ncbi:hypothetical protein BUALT_Bualt07G0138400 [Buddleja alternifolia]|uniref:Uncharacterized protein n=1 Tax=Buddleja alternifolia TaxID=168488 RepID=A0AAV6XAP2_9LAMI|nr:hypothetical protein BUALT_Bualt07G0138400 [Buddleja alternifolia]